MHISVCICVSAIRTVDTTLQVYGHVSVTTQVNAHEHLTIAHYFLYIYCLNVHHCSVSVLLPCPVGQGLPQLPGGVQLLCGGP